MRSMMGLQDAAAIVDSTRRGQCPFLTHNNNSAQVVAGGLPTADPASSSVTSSSEGCGDNSDLCSSPPSAASDVSNAVTSGLQHRASGLWDTGSQRRKPHPGCHQAWELRPPVLRSCPRLSRRRLRALEREWTLAEVTQHCYPDDAWIAVNGKVYDITEHLAHHPGWSTGCGISTVLSILAASGTECSAEFAQVHEPYPVAWKQLEAFYIGRLSQAGEEGS